MTVIGPLLLAAVLAAAFLAVEARTADPLVPLPFLADRTRAVADVTSLMFSTAFYAMAFLLMLHMQTVLGYGPLKAGFAYLPYGAGILTGMWLASRAVAGFGTRWTLVAGFLLGAAGLLMLSGTSPNDHYALGVLPGVLVASLGGGLSLPTLTVAAVSGTTEENAGLGSAILTSVQQVGGAVGLSVLIALAARRTDAVADSTGPPDAATEGFLPRAHGRRRLPRARRPRDRHAAQRPPGEHLGVARTGRGTRTTVAPAGYGRGDRRTRDRPGHPSAPRPRRGGRGRTPRTVRAASAGTPAPWRG